MDSPGWSVIGNSPFCRPLVRPDRHGPPTVGVLLGYAAIQRRDIVGLPTVLNMHNDLSRRLGLIRASIQRIQAKSHRFAAFESILDRTVFRMWRGLKDSDIAPEDQFPDGLVCLSGCL